MTENSSNLVVVLNSKKVLEYFRGKNLSNKQINDLQKIDNKLSQGFDVNGQFIAHPNMQDKAMYIANLLINALDRDDEPTIALACGFLATKFSSLKQVRVTTYQDRHSIQLINDQEYTEESPIQFMRKEDLS